MILVASAGVTLALGWSELMRLALMATVFCTGCALSPDAQETAALRPVALLDAYLVAHGMAASYASSPSADPGVVLQLARLDLQAAAAVRTRNQDATARAVAALTAYAASQTAANPSDIPAP